MSTRVSKAIPPGTGVLVLATMAATAFLVAVLIVVVSSSGYDLWGGVILAPILLGLSIPVLSKQAARENDRRLFWLLVGALVLKFLASIVRHYVAFDVYGGTADAAGFHDDGVSISERFRDGNFDTGLEKLTGTSFMPFFTGILYTVIGPTKLGGYIFYTWLGFWGLFFFYRAYTLAVPEGRPRTYARMLFFLPSLLYWPSGIGKESWIMWALGITAYGAAQLLTGETRKGFRTLIVGLWLGWLIRPHIVGLVVLALAFGYLLRRPDKGLRQLAPLAKGVALAGLLVLCVVMVIQTDKFLQSHRIDTRSGVGSVLEQQSARTDEGGSTFTPTIVNSPASLPLGILTVVYRPLIADAHNTQSAIAALEGTFLLVLTLARWRWIVAAAKSIKRQPYVGTALIYSLMFIIAFSTLANFGLLTRERVQLLPFFLIFLTIPPPKRRKRIDELRPTPA